MFKLYLGPIGSGTKVKISEVLIKLKLAREKPDILKMSLPRTRRDPWCRYEMRRAPRPPQTSGVRRQRRRRRWAASAEQAGRSCKGLKL